MKCIYEDVRIATHIMTAQSTTVTAASDRTPPRGFEVTLASVSRMGRTEGGSIAGESGALNSKRVAERSIDRRRAEALLHGTQHKTASKSSRESSPAEGEPIPVDIESRQTNIVSDSSRLLLSENSEPSSGAEDAMINGQAKPDGVQSCETPANVMSDYGVPIRQTPGAQDQKEAMKRSTSEESAKTAVRTQEAVSQLSVEGRIDSSDSISTALVIDHRSTGSVARSLWEGTTSTQDVAQSPLSPADGGTVDRPSLSSQSEGNAVSESPERSNLTVDGTIGNAPATAVSNLADATLTAIMDITAAVSAPAPSIGVQASAKQSRDVDSSESPACPDSSQGMSSYRGPQAGDVIAPAMSTVGGIMSGRNGNLTRSSAGAAKQKSADAIDSSTRGVQSTADFTTVDPNKTAGNSTQSSADTKVVSAHGAAHSQSDSAAAAAVGKQVPDAGIPQTFQAGPTRDECNSAVADNSPKMRSEVRATSSVGVELSDRTPSVDTAKVIQSMGQTEMHFGMRSSEFGSISIRTSVTQQQTLAQISVDHGDLRQAILNHVPSVQEKIAGNTGLQVSIQMTDQGSQSPPGSQHPNRQGHGNSSQPALTLGDVERDVGVETGPVAGRQGSMRLDIRA